jgi:hypothetical protein
MSNRRVRKPRNSGIVRNLVNHILRVYPVRLWKEVTPAW